MWCSNLDPLCTSKGGSTYSSTIWLQCGSRLCKRTRAARGPGLQATWAKHKSWPAGVSKGRYASSRAQEQNNTIALIVRTAWVTRDYCCILLLAVKNEAALTAHVHSQNKAFHKLFCCFYLSFWAFLLCGRTTYFQRRQLEGVTPSNECIYHPRLYRLFCESTLCEVSHLVCVSLLSSSHCFPFSLSLSLRPSLSLSASHIHNYSSGLKQRW